MIYYKKDQFIIVRVDKDEELIDSLKKISIKESIKTAFFQGIGGVENIETAYYSLTKKQYISSRQYGQFEMTSLMGNIIEKDGELIIHAHITFADCKTKKVFGGHLSKAVVWATAEIIIQLIPIKAIRKQDKKTGLNLIDFPTAD